jgi:hypothetical protein
MRIRELVDKLLGAIARNLTRVHQVHQARQEKMDGQESLEWMVSVENLVPQDLERDTNLQFNQ